MLRPLCLTAALGLLTAASAATPPVQVTYRVYHYTCDGGKKISVSYMKFGTEPLFAVLDWNGGRYGLAQAISASGARYASLSGPVGARGGLQWWEHQGRADLSTFTGTSTVNTKTLLSGCKTPAQR